MMVAGTSWGRVETLVRFHLEERLGWATARAVGGRLGGPSPSLAFVEGTVARVDRAASGSHEGWIHFREGGALGFRVPTGIDLGRLVGRRIAVTLRQPAARATLGTTSQTLTIADAERRTHRVLLVAHAGAAGGNIHRLGALDVHVALSRRSGGPLVFGAPPLQALVPVGGQASVRDGDARYVLDFLGRSDAQAVYTISEETLRARP